MCPLRAAGVLICQIGLVAVLASSCAAADSAAGSDSGPKRLSILSAASVGIALREIGAEIDDLEVRVMLSSSRTAISLVRNLRSDALVVSADAALLRPLLAKGELVAAVHFASNALVLAYNLQAPGGKRLAAGEAWQVVLADEKTVLGLADPGLAPAGKRALEALVLNDEIEAPRLQLGQRIAQKVQREHTRPDVTKVIAPLQAGEFDCAFVYRSDALSAKLPFLDLDPRINFSEGDEKIRYALGIPPALVLDRAAAVFTKALLSPAGRTHLQKRGLVPLQRDEEIWEGDRPWMLFSQ